MQKLSKQGKNSSKTIKTLKASKYKDLLQIKVYSPKQNIPSIKKMTLKKFKSIPTITHRDMSASFIPSEMNIQLVSQCTGNITGRPCMNHSDTEFNIVQSISERHHSPSKHSFLLKLPPKQKKSLTKRSRKQSKVPTDKSTVLYQRTRDVLQEYQRRQNSWVSQKKFLLSEIEKYKKRLQQSYYCKSYTSIASTHNSQKVL